MSTAGGGTHSTVGLQRGRHFASQRVKCHLAHIFDNPIITVAVIQPLSLSRTPRVLTRKLSADAGPPVTGSVTNALPQAAAIASAVVARWTAVASDFETLEEGQKSSVKVSVAQTAEPLPGQMSPRLRLNMALGLGLRLTLFVALAATPTRCLRGSGGSRHDWRRWRPGMLLILTLPSSDFSLSPARSMMVSSCGGLLPPPMPLSWSPSCTL